MDTGEGGEVLGFLAADSGLNTDKRGTEGAFSSDRIHSRWSLHAVLCP